MTIGTDTASAFWIRWRFVTFAIMLIAIAGLAYGMGKLRYAFDYKIFFPPNDETVLALDKVHEEFWQSNTLLFVIKNEARDLFNAEDLAAIHQLTTDSWQVPHSYRVDSITNYQHVSATNDVVDIAALMRGDEGPLTLSRINEIKAAVDGNRDLVDILISQDAATTGVMITLQIPADNPFGSMEATFAAREMVVAFAETHPDLTIKLTGLAAVETAYPEVTQQDFNTLTPAMYVLILVVTTLMFRSVGAMLSVLITVSLATVGAMGFAGWIGFELTALTALVPTIVLVIGVADIIHIISTTRNLTGQYDTRLRTVTEAMKLTFRAITSTSVTTAVGFASLAFAASPPYQEFGIHAAVGTLLAYAVTLALAPVILPFLRFKRRPAQSRHVFDPLIERLVAAPGRWLAVLTVALLAFAYAASQNRINDRIIENFDETIPVRQATEFAFDNLTGIYRLEYVAYAAGNDISDPGYLKELETFSEWLRKQPEVQAVTTLTDTIKKLNKAIHNDDPDHYRLPTDPGAAAQTLLLYEMSLPFGMDMSNQVNIDKSASRVIAILTRLDTMEIREIKERADQWWAENADKADIVPSAGTGETIIFANLTHINIEYMVFGTVFAMVLITLFIAIFLRSVSFAILSIVPNTAPFVVMFGVWGLISAEINTAAANVIAILYGLFVDTTIHLLHEYKRQRSEAFLSVEDAVVAAYRNVMPAITANTAILFSGFMVLNLSPFSMNADLGLLGAIGIICGLVADIVIVPPLIVLFERLRKRAVPAANPSNANT